MLAMQSVVTSPALGQIVWSGTSGTDTKWSTAANWAGGKVPAAADAVRFGDEGADATQGNVNNTVDALFGGTILGLQYAQVNQLFHTTLIEPGKTLTLLDDFIVGSEAAAPALVATITGPGASLVLTNPAADLVVRQGGDTVSSRATLDMSGLDTFVADVNRVIIGRADPSGYPNVNRNTGWLYLAKTNRIRAGATNSSLNAIAIEVGRSGSNNGSGSRLYLGQTNLILASSLSVGMEKETACQMLFNPAFADAFLVLRAADGLSRVNLWTIGDGESNSGTTSCQGTADFTGGTVDALVDTMTLGRASANSSGTGNSRGTLTIERGIIDVNTLQAGLQTVSSGKNGAGTINVAGGTLRVNSLLELGRGAGGAGLATTVGRLVITGGSVFANQIVCGIAGSEISLSGGTLISSNQIGNVATPLGIFTLTDATLPLAVGGSSAAIVVSNLVTAGAQNIINVTALPPVAGYPATLPLISYQGGAVQGSGNNFALGSLPAANPAFQGRIVDTGTAIALELINGPVTDLKTIWTGAADANWDSVTLNWLNKGVAAAFNPGGDAYFLDSAVRTNVNLVEALKPGSVIVSNNASTFTFSGPGRIAEGDRLVKDGTASLVVANEGTNVLNSVTVKAGTLQLGVGGTNGTLNALAVTNNSNLVVDRSGLFRLAAPISGTGSLLKKGPGLFELPGDSTYTGETLLQGGTLAVNGTLSGGGKLTGSAGTTLTGSGTYQGPVQSSGSLNPGGLNTFGLLRLGGNLTADAGAELAFDLSADPTPDPAMNDALNVTGSLTLNNTTLRANLQGIPQAGTPYHVITHGGIASGSFSPTVGGTHYQAAVDATSSPGQVFITFNNTTGLDLKWTSTANGSWNAYDLNWSNRANNQPAAFYTGDTAFFDDTPGVVTNLTIDPGVTVVAAGITNKSDANNFTVSGAGRLSGPAAVQKEGKSILTLGTANNFTGPVVVLGGSLRTGNATALGTTAAGTTIFTGATLDLNGQNLGQEAVTAGGSGVEGKGAIVNNGPDQTQALRLVNLTGDTVFGGTGRWDIRNGTLTIDPGLSTPVKITKVGTNQFSFVATTIPALLGDVDVQEGTFAIQTTTAQLSITANGTAFGDPSRIITVRSNATLNLYALGLDYPLDKRMTLQAGATLWNDSGTCVLAGPVTLDGSALLNIDGGTTLNITGVVNGPGSLSKDRTGLLTLSAANTFSGDTLVQSGTLSLLEGASIANTRSIAISPGAILAVTNRADATLTLVGAQVVRGSGTIAGSLVVPAGATVASGSPTGTLSVSGAVTLAGTAVAQISPGTLPNCGTLEGASITYGGTLVVTNVGAPLTGGESYKLFNATGGTYPGAFASTRLPDLAAGLSWNTNQLASTGTISITGTAVSPSFGGIQLSADQVVMSGSGGIAGGNYYVLTSTNLVLPSGWTPLLTNAFTSNGNFAFTNTVDPNTPQRFYRIQLP